MKKLLIVLALLVPAQAFSGQRQLAAQNKNNNLITPTDLIVGGGVLGFTISKIFQLNDFKGKLLCSAGGTIFLAANRALTSPYREVLPGIAVGGLAGIVAGNLTEQNRLNFGIYGAVLGGLGLFAYSEYNRANRLELDQSELFKRVVKLEEGQGEMQRALGKHGEQLTDVQKNMATSEQVKVVQSDLVRVEGKVDGVATTQGKHGEQLTNIEGEVKKNGEQNLAEHAKTHALLEQLVFSAQSRKRAAFSRSRSCENLRTAASSDSGNDENRGANFAPVETSTPAQISNRSLGDSWVTSFDCDGAKYSANITEVTSMFFNK